MGSEESVPRFEKAGRGGFMRRFLTLVCLLCLAIPAGISISGCTRNPGADYCNGDGYGMKIDDVAAITLTPATTGISLAYGQTQQISSPAAVDCKGTKAIVATYSYGTSNNQLVDITPNGSMCAGTWNRNSGGGIANYTICSPPSPLPSTGGLPYATAYVTASAHSIVSNPVEIFVHAPVTSVSLVTNSLAASPLSGTSQQCFSQGTQATLDAQACYVSNNTQYELCTPTSVSSTNYSCAIPPTPLLSATYVAGGSITGAAGQTCNLGGFNNGATGAAATVTLTGADTIAGGTALNITTSGANTVMPPTTATLSSGSATCTGIANISSTLTPLPNCTAAVGTLSYNVGTSSIASIVTNTTTNQVTITAGQPGTTTITASVAGSSSSAGYFSTCPPKSISVTLASGETAGTITKGVTQNLVTTVTDTQGNPINGLTLDYQSTDPIDISAGIGGAITTNFPGVASVYAICQPSSCNPSPLSEVGLFGTGLPISSNPVTITTPGTASDYAWFAAPGQSQYVFSVELLSGTTGSLSRLPYVPNSMVMDRLGASLYMGSSHELMVFNTASNSLIAQNSSFPGVVLAVSPNASTVLINDQERQLFYLYSTASSSSSSTFGGMGDAAAWTPDSKTLYITDSAALGGNHSDMLYVYNINTGWTTQALPCSLYDAITCPSPSTGAQGLAITIPSVGAYLSGSKTVAHTWCPTGTVGNYANMIFYPQSDSVAAQTDVLAATTDGGHILGAALTGSVVTLNDIGVAITPAECTLTAPLSTNGTLLTPTPLSVNANAASINQVVPSPVSNLAFITYFPPATGATPGASLPYYVPGIYTPGSAYTANPVKYITLTGNSAITAPLAGAFAPDDSLFFVSTAGDNMIHYISVPTLTDTQQISPNLPACTPPPPIGTGNDLGCTYTGSGAVVPATTIAVKPRSTT
jgi:hypothetical protein